MRNHLDGLPPKVRIGSREQIIRPLVPNRKRRPKVEIILFVTCVDCGPLFAGTNPVDARRIARSHRCDEPDA